MRSSLLVAVAALALASGTAAYAANTAVDPGGDLLASYIGPPDADLDVTSFSVDFDPVASAFHLGATFVGTIDATRPGLYVIGVNTGTGLNHPFGPIDAPNVLFNQAFVVRKDGTTTLAGVNASISDNSFSLIAPLSLFASTGFDAAHYGFNLWPRIALGGPLSQIADFAPNNATIASVPEPGAWALMIAGFGMVGGLLRRRRPVALTA